MDAELFAGLCEVRRLMEERQWVCARNLFDKIMIKFCEVSHG